jgi:CHASE1-domain containing sensor protein
MGENGKSLGFNISSVANQRMPTSTALVSRELLKLLTIAARIERQAESLISRQFTKSDT